MSRQTSRETYPMMADLLAPAEQGVAKVEHIIVTKEDVARASWGSVDRYAETKPGRYASLRVKGRLMMTDTDMERITNLDFVRRATGDVLVAGLGLGMVLHPICAKPDVRSVTVIEKYAEVTDLVRASLPNHRALHVVTADIFDWKPAKGVKYDTIYFDIWPDLTSDNLPQMGTLHRKFSPRLNRTNPACWMGSWRRDFCRMLAQRGM